MIQSLANNVLLIQSYFLSLAVKVLNICLFKKDNKNMLKLWKLLKLSDFNSCKKSELN